MSKWDRKNHRQASYIATTEDKRPALHAIGINRLTLLLCPVLLAAWPSLLASWLRGQRLIGDAPAHLRRSNEQWSSLVRRSLELN